MYFQWNPALRPPREKKYGHLVITTTFFRPGKTAIHFLITSPYYCKLLFPIFTSLHALLTITVVTVLRTVQIAKSRFSCQSCFKVLKDHHDGRGREAKGTANDLGRLRIRLQEITGLSIEFQFVSIRSCNVFVCLPFVSITALMQCVCL